MEGRQRKRLHGIPQLPRQNHPPRSNGQRNREDRAEAGSCQGGSRSHKSPYQRKPEHLDERAGRGKAAQRSLTDLSEGKIPPAELGQSLVYICDIIRPHEKLAGLADGHVLAPMRLLRPCRSVGLPPKKRRDVQHLLAEVLEHKLRPHRLLAFAQVRAALRAGG